MKKAFLVWVTAAMLVLAGSTAWAVPILTPSIQIADLLDGSAPGVTTAYFTGSNSVDKPLLANEFVNISGFVSGLGTFSEGMVMLESAGGPVSDFAVLSSLCGNFNLTFMSDGAPGFRLALGLFNLVYRDPFSVVESGDYQTLFPDVAGKLLITAASDVAAVPLPPSLLLLGSGLLGLAGWRRFRKN